MSDVRSTTIKRVLSAIVALPLYFAAIVAPPYFKGIPILAISILVSLVCLYEYYQIADRGENGRPFIWVGMLAGVLVNVVMYMFVFWEHKENFDARIIMGLIAVFLAIILALQVFKRPIQGGTYSTAVTVMGIIFIVLPFSHIILMKAINHYGMYYILILNVAIMMNDSGAYFGGVLFGKHKTNFAVSPNKSWEGYFSGMLFSIIGMIVANQVFISFFDVTLFTMIEAAILGIFLSILGNTGDLIESSVKRDGGIKDSGTIIPGHGGMWDVFDAMVFTLPLFYYYIYIKGML
ncbi:MAG: phosphatidate cytidylyltransferase [bacterium]|nr:phosphatidate cytidylyltransferase [bacterium]